MKTMINRIQLSILTISLASTVAMAQIPREGMKGDTTKMQTGATKMDSTKSRVAAKTDSVKSDVATKFDSTKVKVVAKVDSVKKDVKVAVEKVIDKVTPDKPKEVAQVTTPKGNITLTADPTTNAVFHAGSLVIGAGFVYQKELLPLTLMGEYGIGKNIGVELRGWYGSKTVDGLKDRDGFFGVGVNYHFTGKARSSTNKFDTYLGALYGKILDDTGTALYAQAGARYFFIKRLGVFGNFNIGLLGSRGTNLSVGLAYNLFR